MSVLNVRGQKMFERSIMNHDCNEDIVVIGIWDWRMILEVIIVLVGYWNVDAA